MTGDNMDIISILELEKFKKRYSSCYYLYKFIASHFLYLVSCCNEKNCKAKILKKLIEVLSPPLNLNTGYSIV